MSDVGLLRRAAAQMREYAEKATHGAWKLWGMEVRASTDGTSNVDTSLLVAATRHEAGFYTWNASHIAAWYPPVALAVADWVEAHARDLESAAGNLGSCDSTGDVEHALTVARAFLREA